MGSLNRESVRDEAERIKLEFNRISSSKKMDSETKMLFQSMLMLVNLLIAIFLEKTTKKTSKNSSKPPSQREKDESSLTHNRTNGKGKTESDAHNLWERLKEYESCVLLFAKKSDVSFTNNRAERDLRMAKVKQKVSGCFRKEEYVKAYCRISSYLQTMASKGHNPLIAIQMALAGKVD